MLLKKRNCHRALLSLAALMAAQMPLPTTRAADTRTIVEAIKKGTEYLKSAEKDGNWELVQKPVGTEPFDVKSGQFTGRTALAAWAILSAGVDEKDPSMASAIKFLEANPSLGVYTLGIREQVWSALDPAPAVHEAMEKDTDLLLRGTKTWDENSTGFYGYTINEPAKENYDHSVSQFGVLGMWAAAQAGLNIPRQYWQMAALSWMSHQYPDGTWTYRYLAPEPADNHDVSMTAAGLATLLIVQDQFPNAGSRDEIDFSALRSFGTKQIVAVNSQRMQSLWQSKGQKNQPSAVAIDTGMKWLGDNFEYFNGSKDIYYTLFGISRVGAASGQRFFGSVDWYQRGAEKILANQHSDGSFNGNGDGDDAIPDTALALLFLERGIAPVMFNKLHYDLAARDGKPIPDASHWNDRPRDANNVARWFGHSTEKFFNWQVVSLDNGVDALHDSPILYLSGDQVLNFSPADEDKLREFVEQGGLILGNAEDGREAFSNSFRKLGAHLFHQYEFRELPANHPIFTSEQFQRSHWKSKPEIQSLGNGVRELMILIPRSDPARAWQAQQINEHPELHQLAANIYLYMADKQNLRYRTPSYIVRADPNIPAGKPMSVARLYYSGNWDPEPAGWRRVAAIAHNQNHLELSIEPVKIAETTSDSDDAVHEPSARLAMARVSAEHLQRAETEAPAAVLSNQPLAHLTGSVRFTLSPAQRAAIKQYVQNGGTLLVDAAAGSSAFKESAESELASIFGAEAKQLQQPLDLDKLANSPIAHALAAITDPTYRHGTEAIIGKPSGLPLRGIVLNGRLAVIYSPLDLTEGMVGEPVDGIVGYSPDTATRIVEAIVTGSSAK
jgi:hypothetical protein